MTKLDTAYRGSPLTDEHVAALFALQVGLSVEPTDRGWEVSDCHGSTTVSLAVAQVLEQASLAFAAAEEVVITPDGVAYLMARIAAAVSAFQNDSKATTHSITPLGMVNRVPYPLGYLAGAMSRYEERFSLTEKIFLAACDVPLHFFGQEWLDRWVLTNAGEKGGFLHNDWRTADRKTVYFYRVIKLAELLLNLQGTPNFYDAIEPMATSGIEAHYAELEAAALLKSNGIDFRFVARAHARGSDYDLAINLGGLEVCGETKCKVEATAQSWETVRNSIEKARSRNLPAGKPGVVFIKVPGEWDYIGFLKEFERRIPAYFMGSDRITAVCVHFHKHVFEGGHLNAFIAQQTFTNKGSRLYDARLEMLVGSPGIHPPGAPGLIDLVAFWSAENERGAKRQSETRRN